MLLHRRRRLKQDDGIKKTNLALASPSWQCISRSEMKPLFVPLFLHDVAKLAQLQPVKPTDRDVNDVVARRRLKRPKRSRPPRRSAPWA